MSDEIKAIKVRGIGKIACRAKLSLDDVRTVCSVASGFPFVEWEDDQKIKHTEYVPEAVEFGFWVAVVTTLTDYDNSNRDLWDDLHSTNLSNKLAVLYAPYMENMWSSTMDRVRTKADSMKPINEAALFNGIAEGLKGVDIGDVLSLADKLKDMNGKEILQAVLETEVP